MTGTPDSTGILLLNLGGPDSLRAVRPFLYNLFSDRDIIRLGPAFLQKPLAWLISTLRSKKTEAMYRQIGGKSPILDITTAQAEALEKALNSASISTPIPHNVELSFKVYIGMRYWHPFIADTVRNIEQDGIRDLIVLSLYPHYSKATTGSSLSDFMKAAEGKTFNLRYINEWYDYPPYIDAMAELVAEQMSGLQEPGVEILYSAHSLPRSFIDEGDPYLDHIKATVDKINARLHEPPYHAPHFPWHLSFQSKTGPVKWLEPSTEETIEELGRKGCKDLIVVPVSFVSDHIETLFEIDIQYQELAEKQGMTLRRCRALNTSEKFIAALRDLVREKGLD